MARFKLTITIDGRPCTATWALKLGGKVHVSCGAWGVAEVDCGPHDRPEAIATKAAHRIVRDYHRKRAAELKLRERAVARVHRYYDRHKVGDDHV